MTLATIIVLSVGVILIIVSFLLTGKDSGEEETEERTTPGLREELTEADKKQLKKLTDNYIREYGKKQVKDSVQSTIDNRVKEAADAKQPAIDEKLKVIDQKMAAVDERLAEIDARSEAGVKAVADEASAISAGWDQNRQEVQSVYEQISEKEKDVKIQLSLIDEYKKGLEKLKEDADLSVNRLQELQQVESAGRFVPAAEEAVEEAAKDAEEAVEEAAEAVEEAVEETAEAAEEAVEEAAEEAEEAVEEAAEESDEDEEDEVAHDDYSSVEEDEEEDEVAHDDYSSVEEDEEEDEVAHDDYSSVEEDEEEDEVPHDDYSSVEDEEEDEAEEEDTEEEDESDEEDEDEEEEDDEDEEEETASNIVAFPQEVDQEAIEEATKETLGRVSRQVEEDESLGESDDYDDDLDEFEEDDDLQAITNLDQILDREGIDLSAEDPTINILTMYGAGLSIIEISKVLKMGVGEVKYIIDSNTKNQ